MTPGEYPTIPVLTAALGCRCPRCGRGPLFQGLLAIRPRCIECGLDLSEQDSGDGAIVLVILVLGAIMMALMLWVEFTFEPSIWLHILLWPPLTFGGAILMMRPLKAGLIAQQYRLRDLGGSAGDKM